MAKSRKQSAIDTDSSTVYLVRQATGRKYLHLDPLNGDWWGPKKGAFPFRSESEACKFAPYYTKNGPFAVVSVDGGG